MPRPPATSGTQEQATGDDKIERVDHLISEMQRRAFRVAALLSRGTNLTFQQYLALAHIGERGPCAVNDLRAAMGIAQSTASELVTRLERGGFVTKERDPRDARSLRVELAPKGREAIRKRRRAAKEFYKDLFAHLTDDDSSEMVSALETLLRVLPGPETHNKEEAE
jgi:DNA-binding MarR family transcriptional regulator